jgi:lauroyl/myristoyl acyltransferase
LERTGDKQKDLYAGVVRVNQAIEQIVRRAPEQYLWIHDRYRTQPPAGGVAAAVEDDELDAEP